MARPKPTPKPNNNDLDAKIQRLNQLEDKFRSLEAELKLIDSERKGLIEQLYQKVEHDVDKIVSTKKWIVQFTARGKEGVSTKYAEVVDWMLTKLSASALKEYNAIKSKFDSPRKGMAPRIKSINQKYVESVNESVLNSSFDEDYRTFKNVISLLIIGMDGDKEAYNRHPLRGKSGAEIISYAKGGIQENLTEEKESGIPERYKKQGFKKVGVKRKSNRPGKKWMVLAKKGDQYRVIHGGDSNMQDYTQHKDKDRQKNFWDRMGGKDSAKANDPFSALYWHKKFGTW